MNLNFFLKLTLKYTAVIHLLRLPKESDLPSSIQQTGIPKQKDCRYVKFYPTDPDSPENAIKVKCLGRKWIYIASDNRILELGKYVSKL